MTPTRTSDQISLSWLKRGKKTRRGISFLAAGLKDVLDSTSIAEGVGQWVCLFVSPAQRVQHQQDLLRGKLQMSPPQCRGRDIHGQEQRRRLGLANKRSAPLREVNGVLMLWNHRVSEVPFPLRACVHACNPFQGQIRNI